jgi:hypothetical protein
MSLAKIYQDKSEPLYKILREAGVGQSATLLIPDLQRPYVWSPNQVVLLVDSLIRGWPFGTLLLWAVGDGSLEKIPARTFWTTDDRTGSAAGASVPMAAPPRAFRMVLDGQQRLQSLLLAIGGDTWGFRLLDREWATVLETERPKGAQVRRHWSWGQLCLDLPELMRQREEGKGLLEIDYRTALQWAMCSAQDAASPGPRPANYKAPLPRASQPGVPARFLRFSRVWDLAKPTAGVSHAEYVRVVRTELDAHKVPVEGRGELETTLAELASILASVKQSGVSFLELSSFDPEIVDEAVYDDAIVNIFTRLNTAGRTLTRQEITFAWIKRKWSPADTGNKSADVCFEELRKSLAEVSLHVEIDELVGGVSAVWSVLCNRGAVLKSRDLLRGEIVAPMAADLSSRWSRIAEAFNDSAQGIGDAGLQYGKHFVSLNAFVVLCAWRMVALEWQASHPIKNSMHKAAFVQGVEALFSERVDRWLLLSQWGGAWSSSSGEAFPRYLEGLAEDWAALRASAEPEVVLKTMAARIDQWLSDLQKDALGFIERIEVSRREQVSRYFVPLWLWHRLEGARWEMSKIPLRDSNRRKLSLDVDHLVSCAYWGVTADLGVGDPETLAGATGGELNDLGNCSLLESTFNRSKSADTLESLLKQVHEVKAGKVALADWYAAMGIVPALSNPRAATPAEIRTAIEERTKEIKDDLKAYVSGVKSRVDKGP